MSIVSVILAGGKAERMGGKNKALVLLGGQTLAARVEERLRHQTETVAINTNRDQDEFNLPIVDDGFGKSYGPLDGILGAVRFAKAISCSHVLTVSIDTPFIPLNLVEKLRDGPENQIAIAASNGKIHGTCALWPVNCEASLSDFILAGKSLKLMNYLNGKGFRTVDFSHQNPDPFFNINTSEDLAAAALWL